MAGRSLGLRATGVASNLEPTGPLGGLRDTSPLTADLQRKLGGEVAHLSSAGSSVQRLRLPFLGLPFEAVCVCVCVCVC